MLALFFGFLAVLVSGHVNYTLFIAVIYVLSTPDVVRYEPESYIVYAAILGMSVALSYFSRTVKDFLGL